MIFKDDFFRYFKRKFVLTISVTFLLDYFNSNLFSIFLKNMISLLVTPYSDSSFEVASYSMALGSAQDHENQYNERNDLLHTVLLQVKLPVH